MGKKILAWGAASHSVLRRLTLLQKRVIRLICNTNYNAHTDPLFKSTKILRVKDQYEADAMLFVFDYSMDNLPKSFNQTFTFNYERNNYYSTRQSQSQTLHTRCHSRFAQNLPLFSVPTIWNKWVTDEITSLSRAIFKSHIKTKLLSNYSTQSLCTNPLCKTCFP